MTIHLERIQAASYGPENSRFWKLTKGDNVLMLDAPDSPSTSLVNMIESVAGKVGKPFFVFSHDKYWIYDETANPGIYGNDNWSEPTDKDDEFLNEVSAFLAANGWHEPI